MIPSILHGDKIAYTLDREYDYRHPGVASWLGQYDTCGDGTNQHSPVYAVPNMNFTDAMLSLCAVMMVDPEVTKKVDSHWPMPESDKKIAFCQSIQYVEGKTRFYNMSDEKISSAPGKAHDRRWEVIRDAMNGSAKSVFNLMHPGFTQDAVQRLHLAYAVEDWFSEQNIYGGGTIFDGNGIDTGDDKYDVKNAMGLVTAMVKAFQSRRWAERVYESISKRLLIKEIAA